MVAEHLTSQRAQRHVVGRVVVHGQLLEDHLASPLDVLIVEQRMRQHIAEQFDTRRVAARHPAVVGRVLLRREGVDVAADTIDGARDVGRRARVGALEQQVLEEVADARQLSRLVAEPTETQTPIATDLAAGTKSVATVRPLAS